jgi:hypothetical protein
MTRLVWLGLIVFLRACEGHALNASDPYDPASGRWRPQVSSEAP